MPSKVIPQEHKDAMVESYLSGCTAKESAEPFGYSWMACISELKRRGIQPRGRSEAHRKYAVDETFFDVIDTEQKAYWLGFLTADANIKNGAIQLHLSAKDKSHVQKLLDALQSEHPIYNRIVEIDGKEHLVAGVNIGSQKLSSAIQKFGVVPRKSLVVKPNSKMPADLIRHYWRGVVDGDGCISRTRNRGHGSYKWSIGLIGSKAICRGFSKWAADYIKSDAQVKSKDKVFTIRYNGTRIAKVVVEQLYKESNIWLERKYKLALAVIDTKVQRQNRSDMTAKELNELYVECGNWRGVAQKLGTSSGGLYNLRRRLAAA